MESGKFPDLQIPAVIEMASAGAKYRANLNAKNSQSDTSAI
jgi:hypothetical protein